MTDPTQSKEAQQAAQQAREKQAKDREAAAKDATTKAADLTKLQEAQRERMAGKPTPTQAENDQAKLGIPVEEHEADGSPEQPPPYAETRDMAPAASKPSGAGYQTRTPTKPA